MRRIKIILLFFLILPFLPGCEKRETEQSQTEPFENPDRNDQRKQDEKSARLIIDYEEVSQKTVDEWNDLGLQAHKNQDYHLAAEFFSRAIAADSSSLYAHYNLASVLTLIYGQGELKEDMGLDEVFSELEICLGLDPTPEGLSENWVWSQILEDPNLDAVRKSDRFENWYENVSGYPEISELAETEYQNNGMKAFYDHLGEYPALDAALLSAAQEVDLKEICIWAAETDDPAVVRLYFGWPENRMDPHEYGSRLKRLLRERHPQEYRLFTSVKPLPTAEWAVAQMILSYWSGSEPVIARSSFLGQEDLFILPPRKTRDDQYALILTKNLYSYSYKDSANPETLSLVIADVLFCNAQDFEILWNGDFDPAINDYGELADFKLQREIYYLIIDEDNNIVLNILKDDQFWQPAVSGGSLTVEFLTDEPALIFAITHREYSSHWKTLLQVYAIDYRSGYDHLYLDSGDPLVIEQEWPENSERQPRYENLRLTDMQTVVIEKVDNGERETIELFRLSH